MRDGRAEEAGEGFVAGLVQVVLVAEEDDLVGEERGADLGDGIATEPPPSRTPPISAPIRPPIRVTVSWVRVAVLMGTPLGWNP